MKPTHFFPGIWSPHTFFLAYEAHTLFSWHMEPTHFFPGIWSPHTYFLAYGAHTLISWHMKPTHFFPGIWSPHTYFLAYGAHTLFSWHMEPTHFFPGIWSPHTFFWRMEPTRFFLAWSPHTFCALWSTPVLCRRRRTFGTPCHIICVRTSYVGTPCHIMRWHTMPHHMRAHSGRHTSAYHACAHTADAAPRSLTISSSCSAATASLKHLWPCTSTPLRRTHGSMLLGQTAWPHRVASITSRGLAARDRPALLCEPSKAHCCEELAARVVPGVPFQVHGSDCRLIHGSDGL